MRDGVEFVVLTVKGQSFMLHHIRKMIGMSKRFIYKISLPHCFISFFCLFFNLFTLWNLSLHNYKIKTKTFRML